MGDFDRRQLEQLNAIGEYLQQIRQDQGRSLDDISAKTYIPLRILRALEGGQGAVLPEPVFVQGFIRRYADALGLDGTSLSRNFPVEREIGGYDAHEAAGTAPTQTLVETRTPEPPRSDYAIAGATGRQHRYEISLPIAIAGVLILGGLAFALSRWLFAPQPPQPEITAAPAAPNPPIAPATAPPSPTAAPSPAASPSPAATPSATRSPAARPAATSPASSNAPINVAMNVTADAWVEVTADGRVTYEGILQRGTQRNWSAQEELTIVSGNAGGVSLSHNRGTAKPMGAPGTVQEVTFTANSDSSAGDSPAPN